MRPAPFGEHWGQIPRHYHLRAGTLGADMIGRSCTRTRWTLLIAGMSGPACGADEPMSPIERPAADAGQQTEQGVDLCAAARNMLTIPGVLEGMCALPRPGQASPSAAQCTLCAAGTTALERLWPDLECHVELRECPVGDEEFTACFATVGGILADSLPRCSDVEQPEELDAAALALRIATSTCATVLVECPPLQSLVLELLSRAQTD